MTLAVALILQARDFAGAEACITSECAACWERWGPRLRGRPSPWIIRAWSGPRIVDLGHIAVLRETDHVILKGLTILPLPDAALSLIPFPRSTGSGFLGDIIASVRRCNAKMRVGLWIFYLKGCRRVPPLRRRDTQMRISSKTTLEANCIYTNLEYCLNEPS